MKLPNAHHAVIAPEKLRDYLLNVGHRRGSAKARLLIAMGYSPDEWRRLESDLRAQHLTADVGGQSDTDYGVRFEVIAPLTGPNGKVFVFRSIWQIDVGTVAPRLLTMYPE